MGGFLYLLAFWMADFGFDLLEDMKLLPNTLAEEYRP